MMMSLSPQNALDAAWNKPVSFRTENPRLPGGAVYNEDQGEPEPDPGR